MRNRPANLARPSRRGITLLFVISLIVLFLLMGTSFVLLAGQYRKSATANSRVNTRIDSSRSLISRAFYDLIREPDINNINSPLRGHSILGDQYGYGVVSRLRNPEIVPGTNNQIIRFQLDLDLNAANGDHFQFMLDQQTGTFSDVIGSYDGMVISFTSGPLAGTSTRILRYEVEINTAIPANQPAQVLARWFYILPPKSDSSINFVTPANAVAGDVTRYNVLGLQSTAPAGVPDVVFNNRDFAGTGAGILSTSAIDEAALVKRLGALPADEAPTLRPNRTGESARDFRENYSATLNGAVIGVNHVSTNEDYDAVDFQNMFLGGWVSQSGGGQRFIPSFHRPSLVKYNNGIATPGYITKFRGDSFVANIGAADYYTDANNDGIPDNGYDVDNDNDGFRDGIWMDISLSIQTDASGRRLKPLVSYMVLDMDSRLNVNFNGNLSHAEVTPNRFKTFQGFLALPTIYAEGQGYGPPEISLASAMSNPLVEVPNLLRGGTVNGYPLLGRYGSDLVPGIAGRDPASLYRLFTYPNNSFNPGRGLLGNGFSSPMDIHGRVAWGVPNDFFPSGPLRMNPYDSTILGVAAIPHGMPVIDMVSSALPTEIVDTAYEMNYTGAPYSPSLLGVDTPFSPNELESLLRRYDWDSKMLPNRLRLLLQDSFNSGSSDIHGTLTTDSTSVPVLGTNLAVLLNSAFRNLGAPNFPPLTAVPTTAEEISMQRNLELMLAPEVIQGRKMDLNFPIGNGLDDDRNGVVDEPAEAVAGEPRPYVYGGMPRHFMDYDLSGTVNPQDAFARQIFARHLYVLILLTTEYVDRNGDGVVDLADWVDYNNSGGAPNVADLKDYRRDVAQWVANIVDFRDPDSICTPFEFDLNPWDGWQVDGDISTVETLTPPTDRLVVWGAERPELLLSESFVGHDRKTTDEATETPAGGGNHSNNGGTDDDLDSRLVPSASCFIELYNPWYRGSTPNAVANTDVFPAEFYGAQGVDLRRMDLATGTAPVWRIEVLGYHRPTNRVRPVRTIYFQRPGDTSLRTSSGPQNRVFFPTAMTPGELQPGQYAVLGSTGVRTASRYTTFLGRRNTPGWALEMADTRRITLDTNNAEVSVRWWDDNNTTPAWQTATRTNVLAIAVGQEEDGTPGGRIRSLGLTDPAIGYEDAALALNPNATLRTVVDGQDFYDSSLNLPITFDEPIDKQANLNEWNELPQIFFNEVTGSYEAVVNNSTDQGIYQSRQHSNARVILLKRLANPLVRWNPDPSDPEEGFRYNASFPINPYLTVDQIGADVAVFNGVTDIAEDGTTASVQANRSFLTLDRSTDYAISEPLTGLPPAVGKPTIDRNLWRADDDGRDRTVNFTPFLNDDFHFRSENLWDSLGEPDLSVRNGTAEAYPWLTWNNRPYVSQLELANVPCFGNGQLLRKFDIHNLPAPEFQSVLNGSLQGSFGHLPNMFSDSYSRGLGGVPGMHRIMDFVEVPSRFVGTTFDLNPGDFANSSSGVKQYFNPPYNTISKFRDPGKINLNTIGSDKVWRGLMGPYSNSPSFTNFDASRGPRTGVNPLPTEFPYVFRNSVKSNLVPVVNNMAPNSLVVGTAQSTLFRSNDPSNPDSGRPIFDHLSADIQANTSRNAYFRYDERQRLGNLVTNRSSVFAIWITVGFFELDDQGNITDKEAEGVPRQRGFYLIDRSIPVAFEPGKNHNVDRIILTSSIIE